MRISVTPSPNNGGSRARPAPSPMQLQLGVRVRLRHGRTPAIRRLQHARLSPLLCSACPPHFCSHPLLCLRGGSPGRSHIHRVRRQREQSCGREPCHTAPTGHSLLRPRRFCRTAPCTLLQGHRAPPLRLLPRPTQPQLDFATGLQVTVCSGCTGSVGRLCGRVRTALEAAGSRVGTLRSVTRGWGQRSARPTTAATALSQMSHPPPLLPTARADVERQRVVVQPGGMLRRQARPDSKHHHASLPLPHPEGHVRGEAGAGPAWGAKGGRGAVSGGSDRAPLARAAWHDAHSPLGLCTPASRFGAGFGKRSCTPWQLLQAGRSRSR